MALDDSHHFKDVMRVLRGKRFPMTEDAQQTLRSLLLPPGSDAWISWNGFYVQLGGDLKRQIPQHDLAEAAPLLSQMLEWCRVKRVHEHEKLGPLQFELGVTKRAVWIGFENNRVSLQIRTDEWSAMPPSTYQWKAKRNFRNFKQPQFCPHCDAGTCRYRVLSSGHFVCPLCGCSFAEEELRSE